MNEEKREKESLKKQKRIILIVIASLIAFAIVYFLIGLIDFDALFAHNKQNDNKNDDVKIFFYDESYSKYPTEDEWYMNEAFKNITYVYGTGTIFSDEIQTAEDAKDKSEALLLLYNLIESIKDGNDELYNKCFSPYYFESHAHQGEFTKQKIYDIIITELPAENKSIDGKTFVEYIYTIEYRIRHNNGTLRNDVGSDRSKKQYVKISDRFNGTMLIDDMYTVNEIIIQ